MKNFNFNAVGEKGEDSLGKARTRDLALQARLVAARARDAL